MSIKIRPEVRRFAEWMELMLRRNEHKGGWKGESFDYLLAHLMDETSELVEAVEELETHGRYRHRNAVVREAADVANFCVMVADVAKALDAEPEIAEHRQDGGE